MTPKNTETPVLDDPIARALEALDGPRSRQAADAARQTEAAVVAARAPVRALIRAVLAEAEQAGGPVAAQLARPLAADWAARAEHFEAEDLRRFDGVLMSLTTAAQRGRTLVGECERLDAAIDAADVAQLATIEATGRELIPQIASLRTRGAAALAECAEASAVLARAVSVLQTHVAWLRPAEEA
jgi:hypothetical protein